MQGKATAMHDLFRLARSLRCDPADPGQAFRHRVGLHIATGNTVIAAMDAGNLMPVAEALRARFPTADLVLVADNDEKPNRHGNPGDKAARKVALAVDGRLAVPGSTGDANDLFCAEGPDAVAGLVTGAARTVGAAGSPMPMAVDALLAPYRRVRL